MNSSIISPGSSIAHQRDSIQPNNSQSIDFFDKNSLDVQDAVILPFTKSKQSRQQSSLLKHQFRRYKKETGNK